MKSNKTRLLIAGLFLCAAMPVLAREESPEETKLEKASIEMDKDAVKPEGGGLAVDKLKAEFGVDAARIQGLRDKKLGYGEVSITLSLAQAMPGGITDENMQQVLALRQGPPVMGWGKVAKELGLKLGPVISKVKRVSAEARKQAAMLKNGEKGGKREKPERPDKPGSVERPGKGGRPESRGKH